MSAIQASQIPKQVAVGYGPLPSNNISQKLFESQLPNCEKPLNAPSDWAPSPCCLKAHKLKGWYTSAPVNAWNEAGNHEGGPPFNSCTEDAFIKQCLLSQHFTYLSGNNTLNK